MKRLCCILLVLLVAAGIGAAFVNAGRSKMLFFPFVRVPNYLSGIYYAPDSPLYKSQVLCYSPFIAGAKMIIVDECLGSLFPLRRGYYYDFRHFLSENHENIGRLCRNMPGLLKRTVKYGRYEFLEYDAGHLADCQMNRQFSVIKDKGKVIWYACGEKPGDIRLLDDGRYMIATSGSVFYVRAYGKRLVAEKYASGRMWSSPWNTIRARYPDEIRILTDNVIRLKYSNGAVQHWKVRLSEKDVEKNIAKYSDQGGGQPEWFYANKCLLWSNGLRGSSGGMGWSHAMWCCHKGGPEPAPESYADISYEKTVGGKDKTAALDADTAAGEADGLFALLPGRIKAFFAGLFA